MKVVCFDCDSVIPEDKLGEACEVCRRTKRGMFEEQHVEPIRGPIVFDVLSKRGGFWTDSYADRWGTVGQ